jgi:transcriptional regulator with XRE-family HTH domain
MGDVVKRKMDKMDKLCDRVKFLRIKHGLTQPALASKIEVPMRTYLRYERGERDFPLNVIESISKALDVRLENMLYGNEDDEMLDEIIRIYKKIDEKRKQILLAKASLLLLEKEVQN